MVNSEKNRINMRPIADIRKEGEELGYRDADLREFVKDQQALEREREIADRAERAAVRQQQKLDAETEQKKDRCSPGTDKVGD